MGLRDVPLNDVGAVQRASELCTGGSGVPQTWVLSSLNSGMHSDPALVVQGHTLRDWQPPLDPNLGDLKPGLHGQRQKITCGEQRNSKKINIQPKNKVTISSPALLSFLFLSHDAFFFLYFFDNREMKQIWCKTKEAFSPTQLLIQLVNSPSSPAKIRQKIVFSSSSVSCNRTLSLIRSIKPTRARGERDHGPAEQGNQTNTQRRKRSICH